MKIVVFAALILTLAACAKASPESGCGVVYDAPIGPTQAGAPLPANAIPARPC